MKLTPAQLPCCLKDCGFNGEDTRLYLEYAEGSRITEQLRLLNSHRRKLMDALHTVQKQVDTVDFMIYSVKQNKNNEVKK